MFSLGNAFELAKGLSSTVPSQHYELHHITQQSPSGRSVAALEEFQPFLSGFCFVRGRELKPLLFYCSSNDNHASVIFTKFDTR